MLTSIIRSLHMLHRQHPSLPALKSIYIISYISCPSFSFSSCFLFALPRLFPTSIFYHIAGRVTILFRSNNRTPLLAYSSSNMRFNFFFGVLGVVSAVCAAPSPSRPDSHTARELLYELSALNTTATAWTTDYTTVQNFPREEKLQIEVFYDSNIDEGHTVKHLDEKVKATIRALETESRTLLKDSQVEYKFKGNPHFGDRRCGFIYRFVGGKNYYHAYVRLGQIKKGREDQERVVRVLVGPPS
ncbi:hypothetical protein C8R41DRAFT_389838 [Lentinula lateritia]|uniref:Uncharacterized protein n=1 Tax=Lentinula lateritia TaxID=40482 RepID=A0ABQ8VGN1_9AGAR|nr:hypothetical protein C8R41DRAFT_389838 [Lentinula lateritia]